MRLGEKDNDTEIAGKGSIVKDKTDNSEELTEEKVGDKDHNIELEENDEILGILLDMHEDVPLGDPGPNIEIKVGEEGAAGVTQ